MRMALVILGLLILAGLAYVRLAPSDPARWHVAVDGAGDADFASGARRVIATDAGRLAEADAWMRAQPRTTVLAGSVEEGRITYVTRTKVFGFPDYTTLDATSGELRAQARLRFGASDLGVNRERLEGLIAALQ
jgi:uncharacterized protein (DUF1499 family)